MTSATVSATRRWRPQAAIANPWLRYGLWVLLVVWFIVAVIGVPDERGRLVGGMELDERRLERIARGVTDVAPQFLASFLAPDFRSHWDSDIGPGIAESVTMAIVATALGFIVALPVGIGAARNLVPRPVYLLCRGLITISRAFHELVVAVIIVAIVGFGPLAGVITLVFGTVGFFSKLLADEIETLSVAPLEAVRATGAGWWQWLVWGVLPQVKPRIVGLTLYRLDINLRESAILGVVGAGGIGAALHTSLKRYEFSTSSAIILVIAALVIVTELASAQIRRRML